MAFSCNDGIFLQMEKSEVNCQESRGVKSQESEVKNGESGGFRSRESGERTQESKAILRPKKESESYSTPWKRIRKPFNAFNAFLGSERPIGLIERLVYRAPKNEGRTIHKCAPINTVVSVLHLQNCCLRIKVSRYRGKGKIKMSSKGISCGRVAVYCIRGALRAWRGCLRQRGASPSIQHPASSIKHRASSIEHAASRIEHPEFSIQHPAL